LFNILYKIFKNLVLKFEEINYKRPNFLNVQNNLVALTKKFEEANSFEDQNKIFLEIYGIEQNYFASSIMANLKFKQNIKDSFFENEVKFYGEENPKFANLFNQFIKAVLQSKFYDNYKELYGVYLLKRYKARLNVINPKIINELTEVSKLEKEYTKFFGSAKFEIDKQQKTGTDVKALFQNTDSKTRKFAYDLYFGFFYNNKEKFDNLFDKLVKKRHQIAQKLNYNNFVDVAYQSRLRFDYSIEDVGMFRENILKYFSPIIKRLALKQKENIGIKEIKYYDEALLFKTGNPQPIGDVDLLVKKTKHVYEKLGKETEAFYKVLIGNKLYDLENRENKYGGGFCTFFPNTKLPFIFANFNKTDHDVKVLIHEVGHAFQKYCCRNYNVSEFYRPMSDLSEIHSFGMEFLTREHMHYYFEDKSEDYLFKHLFDSINFLPYGCLVDHFQHVVYEKPEMSPTERNETWLSLAKLYKGGINNEGNKCLESGRFWQRQGHIYVMPFYYIDYVLAKICALQLWKENHNSKEKTWDKYMKICRLGGKYGYLETLKMAGLASPFDENNLKSISEFVSEKLNAYQI